MKKLLNLIKCFKDLEKYRTGMGLMCYLKSMTGKVNMNTRHKLFTNKRTTPRRYESRGV